MSTQESERPRGLGAAARVTALASSVMDLHVRIALQEVDREKRRLISGGIFLGMGGVFMLFGLLAVEIVLVIWIHKNLNLSYEWSLLMMAFLDVALAGISLRLGGKLVKGPYLPEILEGIAKTTKAVLGKP